MDWVAVSATNDKYEPQAREYLTGLVQLANIPTSPIHLTVDYDVTEPVPGVRYQRVANSSFKAPSPCTSGSWALRPRRPRSRRS